MNIRINHEGLAVPVSKSICDLFISVIPTEQLTESVNAITINFRDPTYSAERGGYHPVEVRLERIMESKADFSICYITDFCYVGRPPFTELAKDIDFDFKCGIAQLQHMKPFAIEKSSELYVIWEQNFLHYAKDLKVFTTTVELSSH